MERRLPGLAKVIRNLVKSIDTVCDLIKMQLLARDRASQARVIVELNLRERFLLSTSPKIRRQIDLQIFCCVKIVFAVHYKFFVDFEESKRRFFTTKNACHFR